MRRRASACRDPGVGRGIAALVVAGTATAVVASVDAVATLKRTGEVACEPSLPTFCANLHVSCTGRTSIPAFAFRLRATPSGGSVDAVDAVVDDSVRRPYDQAQLEWDESGAYVIVRPSGAAGYIKLLADGRYSFRHYLQHTGVMSIGRCR